MSFRYLQAQKPADWIRHRSLVHRRACSGVVSQGIRLNKILYYPPSENFSDGLCKRFLNNLRRAVISTFNDLQQQYDNQLPPDNSFMQDAVEEQVAIIIDRQGLDWLEQHVSTETWGNIVTALEEVAKAEIAEEIEDAQWEWRNRFN